MKCPIQSVFKSSLLTAIVCLSAACSKGTDDYVGYWKWEKAEGAGMMGDKEVSILEIKKDGSGYILTEDVLSGLQNKPIPLTNSDGKLIAHTDLSELSLVLSDDGKTLYFRNKPNIKIDAETKEKIVAHQQKCAVVGNEYTEKLTDLLNSNEFDVSQPEQKRGLERKLEALEQEYKQKYQSLESGGSCNNKPRQLFG